MKNLKSIVYELKDIPILYESEQKTKKVQKGPAAWSQTVLNFSPANPELAETWAETRWYINHTGNYKFIKKFEYFCYFDKNTKNSQDAHQG